MRNLNLMASALTISIAAFAVTTAKADCAQELAAMKTQMGSATSASSSASSSKDMATDSQTDASSASSTPAAEDQAAAAGDSSQPASDASGTMASKDGSTGNLSGVAPTAALGEQAKGTDTAASSNSSGEKPGGDMAKADGKAMTNMSGTEATKSMSDAASTQPVAGGQSSEQATGNAMADSGSANTADDPSTASTNAQGSATGGMSKMATQQMAAAQLALDSGNEEACMDAVQAMKQAK